MQVTIAEIKARCPDPAAALARMRELGATRQGRDHQVDTYFAVAHGRLKLRLGDLETNLIHYRREDRAGPKDSQVQLHAPSDGASLHATLSAALDVLVVVDKQREILWADNVKLHLDTVAGLGTFVEIEAIDTDGTRTRSELHEQCRHWLDALAIDPGLLITHSYSDLMLVATGTDDTDRSPSP
ncbi:class IV adenylate cyclase [Pseudonocardia sp. KRD-291]|nr:class IV adenylate cyclase [Pseudonocardia sp. KRD291]